MMRRIGILLCVFSLLVAGVALAQTPKKGEPSFTAVEGTAWVWTRPMKRNGKFLHDLRQCLRPLFRTG